MRTVTVAVWSPMTVRPLGSAYATSAVTSRVAPETTTGAVSAETSASRSTWSPSTETTSGSTSTAATRKPAPGVPVTIGLTGTVRLDRFS